MAVILRDLSGREREEFGRQYHRAWMLRTTRLATSGLQRLHVWSLSAIATGQPSYSQRHAPD